MLLSSAIEAEELREREPRMNEYGIRVRLSSDFRRTCHFGPEDNFAAAMSDGCYPADGFVLTVKTESARAAAELAFAICNSYLEELHCPEEYRELVEAYRSLGNRSLSVGDVVNIWDLEPSRFGESEDGAYGCASLGWVKL